MGKTDARQRALPFHIVFCTADSNRGTGGDIIEYDKAILSRHKYSRGKTTAVFVSDGNSRGKRKYSTVNICYVGSSDITKVHIDLILELNSQPVV